MSARDFDVLHKVSRNEMECVMFIVSILDVYKHHHLSNGLDPWSIPNLSWNEMECPPENLVDYTTSPGMKWNVFRRLWWIAQSLLEWNKLFPVDQGSFPFNIQHLNMFPVDQENIFIHSPTFWYVPCSTGEHSHSFSNILICSLSIRGTFPFFPRMKRVIPSMN